MTNDPNDVVKVAAGTLVQVEVWQSALAEAGIDSRVLGDELTGGIGTAVMNSVELWVHRGDVPRAEVALAELEREKGTIEIEDAEVMRAEGEPGV